MIGTTARRATGGVWRSRWLLWQWTRRDFIVQYRQSLLGLAWAVLQPLLLLLLYGTVFSRVLHVRPTGGSYVVFALCGLAPWTFLATALTRASGALLNASVVVRQVYFPRAVVPLASTGVTILDLAFSTTILLASQIILNGDLHPAVLALVPLYLGLFLLTAGIGIIISLVGALVRDIRFVIPLLIQMGFIVTPIMYPASIAPGRFADIYRFNPMAHLIAGVRGAVILGRWPSAALLTSAVAAGAVLLALAIWYAASVEERLPDLL